MNVFSDSTTVLVIDDSLTVRQSIRAMLGNVNISRSEAATNAPDALHRIKNRRFDVVLCDYHLGDGMSGQELLEMLRHSGAYPLTSVWIMITGERSYERVVAAAEVAPDDYILKPFSSQMLYDRMAAAFQRKAFLRPAHEHILAGREDLAIDALRGLLNNAETAIQKLDVLRLLAETHLAMEKFDAARDYYERILEMKGIPWARMGMARILSAQGNTEESSEILGEIIREAPNYTDAYDALAQNLAYNGQLEESLAILEKAVALSPRNFKRLCLAGESALGAGDPAKAAGFLEKAVLIGRNNNAFTPDVMVGLLQAYSESGQLDKMDNVARELSGLLTGVENSFMLSVCRAISQMGREGWNDAQAQLGELMKQIHTPELSWREAKRFLEALSRLPTDLPGYDGAAWARKLALRFVKTHQEVEQLASICRKNATLIQALHDAYAELQSTNDQAVALTKNKQKAEAAQLLYQAAMETRNDRLGMNGCALLLQLDDRDAENKVREMLAWLPAEHERVRGFNAALAKRYQSAAQVAPE